MRADGFNMIDDLVTATIERFRPWEKIIALETDDLLHRGRGRGAGAVLNSVSIHFGHLTTSASPEIISRLLAEAFRSGQTPPFAELLSRMFGVASPPQQAAILGLLLEKLSEAALASMPDGEAVCGLVGPTRGRGGAISSRCLDEISPDQVKRLARLAEWHDPAIIDRIGSLCAEHTELLAALGEGTLAVVATLLDPAKGHAP